MNNTNKDRSTPEFIRVAEAVRRFGLSRAKIYQFIANGKINTSCLKESGQTKGTRLIKYDSLKEFIESKMTEGATLKT